MSPKTTVSKQTLVLFQGNLGEYLQGFIIERQSRRLAAGTIEYYADELQRFMIFLRHNQVDRLETITPDLIRYYMLELGTTRNAGGVHAAFRAIRAFLNWYDGEFEPVGWKNPIRKVIPPRLKNDPLPGIEIEVIRKLINVCKGGQAQRNKTILLFLLDSGVRAGELLDLNIRDINLITGSVQILHGKGDKARTVFIGRETLREVRRYLLRSKATTTDAPLFSTDTGERIAYNGLVSVVRDLARKAGVPRPGLHDFRRAFALNMLRNGCDLITLARLMGHTDLTVLRRYLAQTEEDLREAHSKGSPVSSI